MNVRELNQEQLDELKTSYLSDEYAKNNECPSYGEYAWAVDNITNEEIYEIYKDFIFDNDDFWCTAFK